MPSSSPHYRQTCRLSKGRVSTPHARYFVTFCTHQRVSAFNTNTMHTMGLRELIKMHKSKDWNLYCATIMPDHLHLLFSLGETLEFQRVISKAKTKLKHSVGMNHLRWQRNFFDHRLRSDASLESFAFYMFMNPYKKRLVPRNQEWTGWYCSTAFRPQFASLLVNGRFPRVEWNLAPTLNDLIELDCEQRM